MRRRALLIEGIHLVGGVLAMLVIVRGAAWAYPQGAATIWFVGYFAVAAVAGMNVSRLSRAWRIRERSGGRA